MTKPNIFLRCAVLVALSIPAMACLNDTEVARQDAQFRSSYADAASASPATATSSSSNHALSGFVAGTALSALIAAGIWRYRYRRS